ncbi:UNVERIFIED_CONTAM: hypothetical protein K2H54_044075, partial [Gekko kuhli]
MTEDGHITLETSERLQKTCHGMGGRARSAGCGPGSALAVARLEESTSLTLHAEKRNGPADEMGTENLIRFSGVGPAASGTCLSAPTRASAATVRSPPSSGWWWPLEGMGDQRTQQVAPTGRGHRSPASGASRWRGAIRGLRGKEAGCGRCSR